MKKCEFEGCERRHYSKGYCQTHYMQHRKGGPLKPIQEYRFRTSDTCIIDGCNRPFYSKDLCNMHYYRDNNDIPLDAPRRGH